MLQNSSASSPSVSGAVRYPARSVFNHPNSIDGQTFQPYPKAKPRKFTMYPLNSRHSEDVKSHYPDANHYLKPKSRLKIAWSNENRTINRPADAMRTDSSKNAFYYRQGPQNNTLHSETVVNGPPSNSQQLQLRMKAKVISQILIPESLHTNRSPPQSLEVEEPVDLKIHHTDDLSDQKSSPVPCLFIETLSYPADSQQSVKQDYMLSNTLGSQAIPFHPCSTTTVRDAFPPRNTDDTTKSDDNASVDINSEQHERYLPEPPSTNNSPSSEEIQISARPIGPVQDIVLMALTEPFLMAWCQDIDHASRAMDPLYTQGNSMGSNSDGGPFDFGSEDEGVFTRERDEPKWPIFLRPEQP